MEIYFSDLTEKAQKRLLKAAGIKDPKETNWDVFPITEITEVYVEDEEILL